MTVFGQLGDPVAGAAACLCEHHGAAYAKLESNYDGEQLFLAYDLIDDGVTIVQQAITTTERCCIVVNAATITPDTIAETALEIERPLATIRTTQEDSVASTNINLLHHAAWEVLPAGTYTYYLVNRSGATQHIYGAWIKIIASDCEG